MLADRHNKDTDAAAKALGFRDRTDATNQLAYDNALLMQKHLAQGQQESQLAATDRQVREATHWLSPMESPHTWAMEHTQLPPMVRRHLHMDAHIIEQIEQLAAANDRTWAAQLRVIVRDALQQLQRGRS
jgi:hypothetical protein